MSAGAPLLRKKRQGLGFFPRRQGFGPLGGPPHLPACLSFFGLRFSPACLPASAVSGGACPRDCSPSRCHHRNPQRCLDTGARARARDPPTRSSSTTAAAGEGEGGTKGVARQESPQSTESDGEVPEQAIKARLSPCHRATPACLPRFFWVALFPSLPACPSKTGDSCRLIPCLREKNETQR